MEEVGPAENDKRTSSPQTSEEDNYMELYVEKQLKDKIDPLEE